MTATDTSTAAVTALMNGVTEGPWSMETKRTSCGVCHQIGPWPHKWRHGKDMSACIYDDYPPTSEGTSDMLANARFIAAARQLVPALLAERDAALAGAVKVKPLVWVDFHDRGAKAQAWNDANYLIQKWSDGRWEISASYPGYSTSIYGTDRFYPTIEAAKAAAQADYTARILAALQPDPDARQADLAKAYGPILDLLPDAVRAAEKAMRKYPQPNYVISKWAEETGEVTKDLIHMAEGRQTADKLRGEIVQSLAMLHRLLVEGDQVHGLPPVGPAIRALTPPADLAAKIGGE